MASLNVRHKEEGFASQVYNALTLIRAYNYHNEKGSCILAQRVLEAFSISLSWQHPSWCSAGALGSTVGPLHSHAWVLQIEIQDTQYPPFSLQISTLAF